MALIQVEHLQKRYHDIEAVVDVSLQVEQGSCFGLLGPNGAGKTTTMEIIEGIIEPTAGTILYKNQPRSKRFSEEIGIQFQHTSLLNFLSVRETLTSYANLYRRTVDSDWLIERCGLAPILNRRNNKLSGGQRQRLMLALALVNDPLLVFLDEPSTGLDPQSRRYLWSIIEDIKESGKTIIMTTHSMEEAENLCDTIAIMDKGLIIAEGSPENLIATHYSTNTITLPKKSITKRCAGLDLTMQTHGGKVIIKTDEVEKSLSALISCGVDLSEMSVHSANLEDVFLHLTGRTLRD
jgi:ABC-2 type transport system ATP-binding protein